MKFLYNIGIFLLGIGLRIASVFNKKARLWVHGRREQFNDLPDTQNKEVIWFHCASLGEFDQGLPLMNKMKEVNENAFLLVTFFSPSGMQHYHKRKHPADFVMYLPLDTSSNAKRFLTHFNPSKAFFVKYEFWSNFIFVAHNNGTLLFNVSGIFRPDHRYFKWYGGFFRKTLKAFDWFFVQNRESLELLKGIGIVNVSISGDGRYDRVLENKEYVEENELIAAFKNGQDLVVIGSCWPQDEAILLDWVTSYQGKVLIAPHNIDEVSVLSIQKKLPEAIRYTKTNLQQVGEAKVLILDTIGQLANAYAYGTIAYVGGGFSGSLHNILEPAVFGLPVIFGPKHTRFPEAQAFIDNGIGKSVATANEFETAFSEIMVNHASISERTQRFIEQNKGSAEKIVVHLTSSQAV